MKIIQVVKYTGITAISLLFISLLAIGYCFEATHTVVPQVEDNGATQILTVTDFNLFQVDTLLVTALCVTYSLLLLPWLLYFLRIEKKSGLQYFSLYPMTGKKAGKIVAVLLTLLNGVSSLLFYWMYINYVSSPFYHTPDSQLSIMTILSAAIIFWGGTYLVYGSLYGVRRFKEIVKRRRERRALRRQQNI